MENLKEAENLLNNLYEREAYSNATKDYLALCGIANQIHSVEQMAEFLGYEIKFKETVKETSGKLKYTWDKCEIKRLTPRKV